MALTLVTSPDDKHSAYRPVIWELTTEDDDTAQNTIASVSDSGGIARFTTVGSVASAFEVGDVVTIAGNGNAAYNRRATISAVSGTYIETNIAFDTTAGGGTITRTHDNFQVRMDFYTHIDGIVITGTADNSPNTDITTVTPHSLEVGDYVLITSTTDYNGVHEVLAVGSTTEFTIGVTFTSSQSGLNYNLTLIASKRQAGVLESGDEVYRFDTSNIEQSLLTHDLEDLGGTTIVEPNPNSLVSYVVNFTEEWDNEAGVKTEFGTLNENFKKAVNAALQHLEVQDLSAYELGGSTKKFLTNAPTQKIRDGEEVQLSFLDDFNVSFKYERYDLTGASTGVVTSGSTAVTHRGILPVNSTILGTSATVSKVDVWIAEFVGGAQRSEKKTFVFDTRCADPIRLHWKNRLGGFDAFTFRGDNSKAVFERRTEYTKQLPVSFTAKDRGTTTLGVVANEKVEAYSEFLTKTQAAWIAELFTSPEVYQVIDSDLVPVNITNTSDTIDEKNMLQFKIGFVYANELVIND